MSQYVFAGKWFNFKITNQELLRKIQEVEVNENNFTSNDALERCPEIKPFSCKYCNKSFFQVHEVKEHIKVHNSISEVEDLKEEVKSLKTQVGELEVKLKNSQSKLASQNGQENEFKKKSKLEDKKEILVPGIDQDKVKKNTAATTTSNTTTTTRKKSFKCPVCAKKFSHRGNMSVHISAVHEGKKDF